MLYQSAQPPVNRAFSVKKTPDADKVVQEPPVQLLDLYWVNNPPPVGFTVVVTMGVESILKESPALLVSCVYVVTGIVTEAVAFPATRKLNLPVWLIVSTREPLPVVRSINRFARHFLHVSVR